MMHWFDRLSGRGRVAVFSCVCLIAVQCHPAMVATVVETQKTAIMDTVAEASIVPIPEASVFLDLHRSVILPNCALGGCHDGNFEPDYRTPQSFYYTTVLHPVIKNSRDSSFTYRVVPYEPTASVLIERVTNCCFNDQNDRMPVLMPPLNDSEIEQIAYWISIGAPNWDGEHSWDVSEPID